MSQLIPVTQGSRPIRVQEDQVWINRHELAILDKNGDRQAYNTLKDDEVVRLIEMLGERLYARDLAKASTRLVSLLAQRADDAKLEQVTVPQAAVGA